MKKLFRCFFIGMLCILFSTTIFVIGCKSDNSLESTEEEIEPADDVVSEVDSTEGPTEERADSLSDRSIIPEEFPLETLEGLDNEKVVPKKQYFIAFSNGSMDDAWRRTFVEDVEKWGNLYQEEYGIQFKWTNAGNNSAKQLSDIETLLSMKPDILLFSPNESVALDPVYDMCEELGIPFICLDREIVKQPDTEGDQYIQLQQPDNFLNGIANGLFIVKDLTEKYGEPAGNVVELSGALGISVSDLRSQGVRYVLDRYPNIRIIESRPADYNRDLGYQLMQDYLEKYPAGEIDGAFGGDDATMLGAYMAVKEAGRDEILPYIYGIDGQLEFLEGILEGNLRMTSEYNPYLGMTAIAYAVSYLNENEIPSRLMVPTRNFSAETEMKKEKLEELVNYCKENELNFVPLELGGQDIFNIEDIKEIYSTPYTVDSSILEGLEPFTTEEPWVE